LQGSAARDRDYFLKYLNNIGYFNLPSTPKPLALPPAMNRKAVSDDD
jgi:hypothetical protein